jgi:hypothetical protein
MNAVEIEEAVSALAGARSAEYCEALVDPGKDCIIQDCQGCSEETACNQQICCKSVDTRPESFGCCAIAALGRGRNGRDMALYPVEKKADDQKDAGHGQADTEKRRALRRAIRDE